MLDFFVNGRIAERDGNRHPSAVPHGVYPCRGTERWCALSVWDDAEWRAFVSAVGSPAWALAERFSTLLGRKAHEAEIDSLVARWTGELDRDEVVKVLRQHGLRAAAVNSMADLFADPGLLARTWRPVDHPVLGKVNVMAPPFLLKDTPPEVSRPAPLLGEHTHAILSEDLGLSDAEIHNLEKDGVLD